MPSSIPFDHPSLVLGNIVDPALLGMFKDIGALQAKIDIARDKMNSYVTMKRSLAMTINELLGMQIDVKDVLTKIDEVDAEISKAAGDFVTVQLANEAGIQQLRATISSQPLNNIESPVDFDKSDVKKLPLASDSMKLDAQFFSYGSSTEDSPVVAKIEDYIKETTSGLGSNASSSIAKSAGNQINVQRKNHSLSGTLIITASCTHSKVALLSPLVLDVDKTVDIWNKLNSGNKIDTRDKNALLKIAGSDDNDDEGLTILSGVSYGSGFVGMVHVLKRDDTGNTGPSMTSIAAGLQERFTVGGWLEESAGGIGVDPSFSDDIKQLLSTQNITSHVTAIVFGAIPSIKSNQVEMGVKTFAETDPAQTAKKLATVEAGTAASKTTVDQAASAAKTGAKVAALSSANTQSVIQGLGKIDQGANKILDINSLMTAFEDYIQEIKKGDAGMPVNFFLKTISRSQLAQLWLEKYYPTASPTPANP